MVSQKQLTNMEGFEIPPSQPSINIHSAFAKIGGPSPNKAGIVVSLRL